MKQKLKTPFPYFGGKSDAAELIWSRFGSECKNYVEPFFGSGAVWLNRPAEYTGQAVVNDLDGNVANFWRAMQADPDAVAEAADYPVNEIDLHARHLWLVNNAGQLSRRLMADPDYCEAKTAGWWAWGCCCWIGGGWCDGTGPWGRVIGADGIAEFAHLGNAGQGVNRQLPHLGNAGKGVNRKLPHLGDAGKGVNRQLPHLGDAGKGDRLAWLCDWFWELQNQLRDTRITCGDWARVVSIGSVQRFGVAAILLDPPYSLTKVVYAHDSKTISGDVREWCKNNGGNKNLRMALCGHDTEHNELEGLGWSVETWNKKSGYQGHDDRERIWFSPGCKNPTNENRLAI